MPFFPRGVWGIFDGRGFFTLDKWDMNYKISKGKIQTMIHPQNDRR